MMSDEYSKYLGSKVKITLINNFNFTGHIISISDENLFLKDKFDLNVTIRKKDIMFIIEVSK